MSRQFQVCFRATFVNPPPPPLPKGQLISKLSWSQHHHQIDLPITAQLNVIFHESRLDNSVLPCTTTFACSTYLHHQIESIAAVLIVYLSITISSSHLHSNSISFRSHCLAPFACLVITALICGQSVLNSALFASQSSPSSLINRSSSSPSPPYTCTSDHLWMHPSQVCHIWCLITQTHTKTSRHTHIVLSTSPLPPAKRCLPLHI